MQRRRGWAAEKLRSVASRFVHRKKALFSSKGQSRGRPEEFYRELEKLRLRFGDLGYNLLKLIEEHDPYYGKGRVNAAAGVGLE